MYNFFLDNRQSMIDGVSIFPGSALAAALMVDSAITGAMAHLHESARTQSGKNIPVASFNLEADGLAHEIVQNFAALKRLGEGRKPAVTLPQPKSK